MGPRPHSVAFASLTAVAEPSDRPAAPSVKARKASAPYAHKTRGYVRTLSATSVGLEMAVAVVLPLMVGIWVDRKLGSEPWLMLLFLCFGFAAGIRAVWRYVAAADRDVRESEELERDATAGKPTPPGPPDDAARGSS